MQAKKTVDKPKMHMLDADTDQVQESATQQGKYARFYALYEQDQRMLR